MAWVPLPQLLIPIPKPGKGHAEPANDRSIALTICLCKTLERMINKRLVWDLESNNLISKFQSGYRAERSTNDNLVRLDFFLSMMLLKTRTYNCCIFRLEKSKRYYLARCNIKRPTLHSLRDKKVREKSRECHNHKPQPTRRKRK